jgi:hypothetical protein
MLAIPPVPVVKDHVHARGVFRQIIHSEELQNRGALSAFALRIELTYAHQLARLLPRVVLPNTSPNHGWKPVEVTHFNSLCQFS